MTSNPLTAHLQPTPPLLTLLRIAPLLSSTASLTHAYMEYVTTSSFLHPSPTSSTLSRSMLPPGLTPSPSAPSANHTRALTAAKQMLIPSWFVTFFNRGVWSVIGLNSLTLVSASLNVFLLREVLGEGRRRGRMWYGLGLVAAVGHYAFVPGVAPSVRRLFEMCVRGERGNSIGGKEEERQDAVKELREWVGMHVVRMMTVDVLAWGSFLIGVLGVVRV